MKVGDEYYYYQNDHLGTPQKVTAGNGEVVWSAKYNSFGKATIEVETIENNLRFAGQYYDQETGNHYNMHRYYDPNTGRYLRPDPIGQAGGINLFVYGDNNSLSNIDPYGEKKLPYPFNIIDNIKDAYEIFQALEKIRKAKENAIQRLKGIKEDRILIKKDLEDCEKDCKQHAECIDYYKYNDANFQKCMRKCLKDWYDDMSRYVWDPYDAIRRKYRDDPLVSPHFNN